MAKHTPFTQRFEQLPASLPIFPLPGAVLLPFAHLPLNIFEPRYLNMVNDALQSDRLIGMIQPIDDDAHPALSQVGCAGRIVRFEETRDGRFEILLSGVARFHVEEELTSVRGYRLVRPNWSPFEQDLQSPADAPTDQILLFKGVLRNYLQQVELSVDADILDKLNIGDLVNGLVGFLPLDNDSKQILLESDSLEDRLKSFTAILQNLDAQLVQH